MIERLVDFAIKNRLLVIFAVLLVASLGLRAMQRLPIDAVPDVTNVQVQVLTNAPALGPLEVEQFITFPIESVMSGLPGLEEVRSLSNPGLSAVTVVFQEGTDIYFARQLVAERLSEARAAIPDGFGTPEMGPISSGLGEIYQFEVRGDPMCPPGGAGADGCFTPMELRSILDWSIAYQLRSVPGVVEVNSHGGELKTYEVQPIPERLTALRVSLSDIFEALARNNANVGGAYIQHAGEQRLVRGEGLVQSLDDLGRIVVATRSDGTPVYIRDVADVRFAPMVRQGAVTRDGRGEAVAGIVMMLMGANSREVAQDVHERVEAIRRTLPQGVTIETFYDRTALIDRTIRTVATNLIEGGALVIVVLLLMLGTLRGGLLVATAIPLSMLAAFIGMNAAGVSGNLMSLGAIDFGLIVDGSVVIVENIQRVLAHRQARGAEVGPAVRDAAREVARPVVFAVGIIMIVYIPILTLQGIEGKMFRPMALTVLFALAGSLVLALTLMPAMAATLYRKGVRERETWLVRAAKRVYEPLLALTMRRRAVTGGIAMLVLAAAAVVAPKLGAEFIPELDEGAFAMEVVRLPSVSIEQSIRMTTAMEQALLDEFPDEVLTVVSKTGRPEIATDPMGVQNSDVFVMLRPADAWRRATNSEDLAAQMEEVLSEQAPGQEYEFSQPIRLRTNELISGARSDVAISIYGEDLDVLDQAAASIVRVVQTVRGAADVRAVQQAGAPALRIQVDREAVARYGVNVADVLDAVSTIGGHAVGEVFEGQRRFTLQVRFAAADRSDLDAIRNIPIATPVGGQVPLGQLARLTLEEGPAQISRDSVQRRVVVQANVHGRDLAGFVAEARARVESDAPQPPGYFVAWGGQFEHLKEASARLGLAVPAALLLIFVLLLMAYGTIRPALIIYLNVPFAATGGIFALWLRGLPFSISAAVGFIALFGIAVLNGVVMVSYIRQAQSDGAALMDAVRVGAMTRLRPVLMTAAVASLGFVPMALSTSAGAEVQRPLATVVIGGLVTATLLTLLVLPAVYSRFGGRVSGDQSAA